MSCGLGYSLSNSSISSRRMVIGCSFQFCCHILQLDHLHKLLYSLYPYSLQVASSSIKRVINHLHAVGTPNISSKIINSSVTLLKRHVLLTRFTTNACYHLDKGCLGNVEHMSLVRVMKRFYPLMPWFLKVPLHNSRRVEKVHGH